MSEVIFDATVRQGKKSNDEAQEGTVRPHQPGESVFRTILSEDIDWKPFPAFPPSVRLAVVVGTPSERGPYTIRVKVPRGVKLMPHKHPEDRVYTVLSGGLLYRLRGSIRCRQVGGLPTWRRYCATGQHVALPLGEMQ